MSSDYARTLKVGDFAKVKGGKRMPAGTALTPHKSKHPYLRIVDFKDGGIDKSNLQYVPDEVFPLIARYVISDRDLYISIVGTIGLVGAVPKELNGANLTENAAKICEIDESRVNGRYLGYFLRSEVGQAAINALTVGSTQPKLALFRIDQIEVPCPPLLEQQTIAALLSALDDRIALLRETNATLEAIAEALFKSWFVDFDPVCAKLEGRSPEGMDEATARLFPDSFEESELGLVPRGWAMRTMADVSTVGIGKTPPRKEQHWFSEAPSDVRWVSIRDMGAIGVYAARTSEFLTQEAVDKFNVRQVPDNTVLMSFKMTIGRVAITDGEMTTNEAIAHFKLAPGTPITTEYIYLHLKQFDFSTLSSTSSIADAVNSKTVREIPILVPTPDVVAVFQSQIGGLFAKLKNTEQQAQTLATLRDTLLPRLISGQLRLPDAGVQAVVL